MTEEPKPARYGVKTPGKRARPHSRPTMAARKNTGVTRLEHLKELLPLLLAVCVGEGWLVLAAYALGLGVPLSDLGVDTAGFVAVAVAVLVSNVAIMFALVARKHATTRAGKAAGMTFGIGVVAALAAPTGWHWLAITLVGSGLVAWKGGDLVPGPTPDPNSPSASLTLGLVGSGLALLGVPAALMLLAGYSARSEGSTIVPLAMQPVISQQTGHIGTDPQCVLRIADRVYIERDAHNELQVVIRKDTPDRFVLDDCTP